MNFNRNTRISLMISLFALLAVITMICYIRSNREKNKTDMTFKTQEIAFISNTTKVSGSTINLQVYDGTEAAALLLNKKLSTYYVPASNVTPATTVPDETKTGNNTNNIQYEINSSTTLIDTSNYIKVIKKAIDDGCKIIICPDASYAETIYSIQKIYFNINFIILDGIPHNANNTDQTINHNVIPIRYNEAEIGFLAGYALVYEGYTSLALMSSSNNVDAVHYAYGFLQGSNLAAEERNVQNVNISYSTVKEKNDAIETANSYYSSGIPIVVTIGDEFVENFHETALNHDAYLITCGNYYDSLEDASQLIAIASKNIRSSVSDVITGLSMRDLSGGKTIIYGANNNGIDFIFDTTKFSKFNTDAYNNIYNRLADKKINLISDATVSTEDLGLTHITIN